MCSRCGKDQNDLQEEIKLKHCEEYRIEEEKQRKGV
jgi:hypothetical protein